MAKEKDINAEDVVADKPSSDREKRWKAYVANYINQNPEKGKAKEARGEFKEVPLSFL